MYLLFAGSHYYPAGGAEDFRFAHNDLELLKNIKDVLMQTSTSLDWWQIALLEDFKLEIVESG